MLIEKGPLNHALQRLIRIATGDDSTPLGCVQLDASDGQLVIDATDLTTWLRITIPCEGDFSGVLPAKALLDFSKPIDRGDRSAPVEFMAVENQRVVVAMEGAMITLPGMLSMEFPDAPGVLTSDAGSEAVTWNASDARSLLSWVSKAVSSDVSRPQICGLLFDTNEVVATDGHRLHVADFAGFGSPRLLPTSSIDVLLRCLPKAGVVAASNHDDYVCVAGEGWVLAVRPLAERFPPYQSVVPKRSEQAAMFEVGRSAMKGLFSKLPLRTSSARINVNGSLEVVASTGNDNLPTAVANAPLLEHLGPDINVCVDPRYIKDAIRTGDDVVVGRFGGGMSSMTLEPAPGLLAVVMLQRD